MPVTEREDLYAVAKAAREFLEGVWPEWQRVRGHQPPVPSQWTCGRSSLFLQRAINEDLGISALWTCGTPRYSDDMEDLGPYGFFHDGRWQSHAWVTAGDWIVDITADQFGAAPVIVSDKLDVRYGEGPEDTASLAAKAARRQTIDNLWPAWRISGMRAKLSLSR